MPSPGTDRHLLELSCTSKLALKEGFLKKTLLETPIFRVDPTLKRRAKLTDHTIIVRKYTDTFAVLGGKDPIPEQLLSSRILDAPSLEDDYYLNLLDWSSYNNHIAVGLQNELFVWNAATGKSTAVTKLGANDRITAVAWGKSLLAIGTKAGNFELLDIENKKRIAASRTHGARIGAIGWNEDRLSSGGRDRAITHYDLRIPNMIVGKVCQAHEQEICGIRWDSLSGKLATGGNDNQLLIWEASRLEQPLYKCNEHVAAVKAIAWSPHQNGLLASGGGTADRTIKFWNVRSGVVESSIQTITTTSQVCNMVWSPHSSQLVTSHGFSEHQCLRWRYPEMRVTGVMRGHEQRVLYMALSQDGTTVVTGSADETLRFWPVFSKLEGRKKTDGILDDNWISIR